MQIKLPYNMASENTLFCTYSEQIKSRRVLIGEEYFTSIFDTLKVMIFNICNKPIYLTLLGIKRHSMLIYITAKMKLGMQENAVLTTKYLWSK